MSNNNTTLLELDADLFKQKFNRESFTIKHHLTDHPLFELPRLIELAQALPESHVEYNSGDVPISQDPDKTPLNGLSAEETLRRIAEHKSWLVLKNVQQDPAYKALLDACLDEVQPITEPLAPGMFRREGFIFVSSPGSVTPYHIDPEYNFLLQIRGTKFMTVFGRDDRTVISEQELEGYLSGGHRNLTYKEEYEEKGTLFELPPGVGLHVPVTAPHWVKNGDEVSVSFSITFQTPENEKRRTVYRVNADLRKRGMSPKPYGESEVRDNVKYNAYRVANKIGLTGK